MIIEKCNKNLRQILDLPMLFKCGLLTYIKWSKPRAVSFMKKKLKIKRKFTKNMKVPWLNYEKVREHFEMRA